MADLRTPLQASRPPSPYRRSLAPFVVLMVLLAIGVATVVFLLATDGEDSQSALSTNPTPVPTVGVTTTVDPEAAIKAEIIAAYRGSFEATVAVASDPAAQFDDPRLSERKTGTALAASQLAIQKLRADGDVLEVTRLELNPAVVELGPNTAVVEDCNIDVSAVVDQRTGDIVKPAGPAQPVLNVAEYELIEGMWMQASFKAEERECSLPG